MMVQVTAAALVAENRVLAHPASTGSITTSGNKEDFVSMGMTSAIKLKQVVRNTRHVLAIELLTATRALDCLRPLSSSPIIEQVRTALAQVSAPWIADRSLTADIESTSAWIATGGFQNLTAG
jgi:histidine ammonia-lyase